jgi:hypothetical protein
MEIVVLADRRFQRVSLRGARENRNLPPPLTAKPGTRPVPSTPPASGR